MSVEDDDRDGTLLDRLKNIDEEGEEDSESVEDDFLINVLLSGGGLPNDDEVDDSSEDSNHEYPKTLPISYEWERGTPVEGSDSNSLDSDLHFSGASIEDIALEGSVSTSVATPEDFAMRRASSSRGSINRNSGGSVQSAPQVGRRLSPMPPLPRRRVSINVPPSADCVQRRPSGRAPSHRRKSVAYKGSLAAGANHSLDDEDASTTSSGLRSSTAGFFGRKSARSRTSQTSEVSSRSYNSSFNSMNHAISSLDSGTNTNWENVAAAAAIVAAGTSSNPKRSHTQFAVDEKVLVFLNVLNHTNSISDRDDFTVDPVNKYGFPRGEGKTSLEQSGPFVYVLATVKKVHFDEDLRYYTVVRADCETEQRADTGEIS